MNLPARGRAAGKVILLGEHAVVYGRPALAAGLPLGLAAEVASSAGGPRLESDHPDLDADPRRQARYRKVALWTNSVLVAAREIYAKAGFRLVHAEPHTSFGHELIGETWELTL